MIVSIQAEATTQDDTDPTSKSAESSEESKPEISYDAIGECYVPIVTKGTSSSF